MVHCQPQLWRLLLLMCLGGLLQTDVCGGQHSVQIQEGPLYRVKGFPMSISCNVSGLKDSREQEFEFLVTKPQKSNQIQIISTKDPGYPYAVYSKRVLENDILIERLSWTSVRFHIKSVKEDDSGKYDCHTPNTYSTYFGTYNAETTMNVIEDTLMASYSGPASYSISEGESLQLECQVSSQTFQHTHLSVTWYLRGTTDTRPIISLDRDLVVRPGTEFLDRYSLGLIAIEKIEDTTYRLKISQVQQSDRGEIYCQAEEWIQDPDRSWFRICHRNTTSSNIEVKALDTVDEVGTFVPQIRVLNPALEEGGVMKIQCSIEAQNLPGRFFSMTWLKNNIEVSQIGPTGVVSVGNTYMRRENDGELRTVKKGDRIFILTIQPVRAEDQGMYQCKAAQEEKTDTGSFIRGQSQLSHEETVHIKAKGHVIVTSWVLFAIFIGLRALEFFFCL
ncbi:immunoglobulin superfamily member 3-like [Clarias gariepinus]|uniref:immunoglobulin superfamily member 3-like n=1 Tax=Clarias gariepinus TaxID=13013 RepID=UPI00234CC109|nr:immunoglobulin superfamily member 3-like [Clarias gariepinus]